MVDIIDEVVETGIRIYIYIYMYSDLKRERSNLRNITSVMTDSWRNSCPRSAYSGGARATGATLSFRARGACRDPSMR